MSESLLKANVIKPGSELHSKLESRLTVTDMRSLNNATVYYEDEDIIVHGKSRTVRRLFVSSPDSDYDGIGWIINEDITLCMVCAQSFGFFRWAHHCRCCGNLVCNACSPEVAVIFELAEMGEVRVCIQCYWGQDPVHVGNLKRDSEESSTESRPENEMDYYFSDHELGSLECATPRSQSMKLKLIIPVPAFVLDTLRKLSFKELGRMNVNFVTRKVYINICVHSCVPIITHGGEYFITDDVAVVHRTDRNVKNYSSIQDERKETSSKEWDSVEYEIYHVLVDPNSLRASLSNDPQNMERTDQLMMRIVRNLAVKFQLGLSKRFEQLADCVYMGGTVTSMYVPYTGSELEDDDDDPARDATFSCDDQPCSDDDESAVASSRPSEVEVDTSDLMSPDLEEWERKVAVDQAEQQAVHAAVEQHISEVNEEDMEEWERKLLQERDEQIEDAVNSEIGNETARLAAEALAIEVQQQARQQQAKQHEEQQRIKQQRIEQERVEQLRLKQESEAKETEERRIAIAKKKEEDAKVAADKSASDRRNAETAAAAVVLAKEKEEREQVQKSVKMASDKSAKEKEERDRAAEKAAALAATEAKRAQDKLDKDEARATALRVKQAADLEARVEADKIALAQKEKEKAAKDRNAKEQAAIAERTKKEQQDREANDRVEAEVKTAKEAASRAASENEAKEREQKESAIRQQEKENAIVVAAETAAAATTLATETARAAQEVENQTAQVVVAAADPEEEKEVNKASKVSAAKRMSQTQDKPQLILGELDTANSESLIVVQIPEINITPIAWCVIKTKTADMTKCFVNIGFHGALPNITETTFDTTAHEEYLNEYFVQFTLNKKRCVMFVGSLRTTSDKDGSDCTLCDVTISMSAYNSCTKDETLVDKLFIKILKALKKKHGVDLDADYKLPKILKNYKGSDILTVHVPAFRSNSATKLPSRSTGPDSLRSPSSDLSGVNPMSSPLKGPPKVSLASSPMASSGSSSVRASISTISPKRSSIVNSEWNQKWGKFVPPGKNIIYTSQIGKKNAMGITIVRQLLLTDEPSLLYVDAVSMTHKGDIEWISGSPPKAAIIDKSNFEIVVAKRVYKFNDRENNAAVWVKKINEVAAGVL